MAKMASTEPIKRPVPMTVYGAVAIIATGGLLFGYIIGINSNVVTKGQIICPTDWKGPVGTWTSSGYGQCWHLTDLSMGVLSSMNLIGALVSSMFCFKYGDVLGRKREVQIGAVLYFMGSCTAALSPTLWGVFLGFAIYGLGIGFAMHAAPVYIAEVSPPAVRGTLVSAKEAAIVMGMVFGYGVGAIFASTTDGWRFMAGAGAIFAFALGTSVVLLHRSPRWLVLQAVQRGSALQPDAALLEEVKASTKFCLLEEAKASSQDKPLSSAGDLPL